MTKHTKILYPIHAYYNTIRMHVHTNNQSIRIFKSIRLCRIGHTTTIIYPIRTLQMISFVCPFCKKRAYEFYQLKHTNLSKAYEFIISEILKINA